jgi:CBS domain containing-hemolysin-like protein
MSEDSSSNGRIWQGLKSLLFGDREPTLRDQIEDAIDEADEDGEGAHGDLSPVERQMLRNLLHFGERTVDDVAVPRGEIIAVPEDIGFDELVRQFAEAGHSRLPVYRESLDSVTGMIHIKDVFEILASGNPPPKSIAAHRAAGGYAGGPDPPAALCAAIAGCA